MMAEESNLDVVRITYRELLDLAAKLRLDSHRKTSSISDEDGDRHENYHSDANSSTVASVAHDDQRNAESRTSSCTEADADDRRNRSRRPDQRLYVPRHRTTSLRTQPDEESTPVDIAHSDTKQSKRYSKRNVKKSAKASSNLEGAAAKDPAVKTVKKVAKDRERRLSGGDAFEFDGQKDGTVPRGKGVGNRKVDTSKNDSQTRNRRKDTTAKGRRRDGRKEPNKEMVKEGFKPSHPVIILDVATKKIEEEDADKVSKVLTETKDREGRWDSWELSDNQEEDAALTTKTQVFVSSVGNWSEEVEKELQHLEESPLTTSGNERPPRRERSPVSRRKRPTRSKKRQQPETKNVKDENRGILHLPSPVPPSTEKQIVQKDRDYVQKHLFNPDNPDKPLVVSQPVSGHTGQQRGRGVRDTPGYTAADVSAGQEYATSPQYQQRAFGYPGSPQQPVVEGPYKIGPAARIAVVEKNIREAMVQEEELSQHLSRTFDRMDLKRMSQIRWKIQVRYENCILADLEFCSKHNIEQTLWKAAFYQVIEAFRREMQASPRYKEDIRTALLGLIDEGVVFYENLLEKLQDTFRFQLTHFLDSDALRPHSSRSEKLAILSAQKVLICLGDLARYQEQANETCQYGKARSWYLKAQQLAPKNGRPYNQLAILALYARRKMDAVYYYMRSLAASNPFVTAKESLIALFDETRKKYEMEERLRVGDKPSRVPSKVHRPATSLRVEIWYTPDGHVSKPSWCPEETEAEVLGGNLCDSPSGSGGQDDLAKLTPVELNKKFVLGFLHVHGKIFSRVGMESYADICIQMLKEFRALLRQGPLALNGHKLLQIITINMYAIHNTNRKGNSDVDQYECRSLLQTRAVEMAMEMFSLLLDRCNQLLKKSEESLNEEFHQHLLPALKVWCDWLLSDPAVWNPLPSIVDLDISGGEEDCWSRLASFINRVKVLKRQINCQLITDRREGCEPVVLPEDTALAGFVPLLHMPQVPVFAVQPFDKEKARLLLRLHRIEYTAEVLCGLNPAALVFDVGRQCYTAAVLSPQDDGRMPFPSSPTVDGDEYDDEDEDDSLGELSKDLDSAAEEDQGSDGGNIRRDLRCRKLQLEKVAANQERRERQIQAVLQEVSQSRGVRFEVHPRLLVPDTNCFIDHLRDMRTLVNSAKYQLVVPLIVINELDGLARGLKPRSSDPSQSGVIGPQSSYAAERAHRVAQVAKEALKFLEDCFIKKLTTVRAVTLKGTFLDTIAFRSEAVGDYQGSNDDIVLNCCLQLCKCNADQQTKIDKGEFTIVRREVVLLTDDRNLRIKAHSQEVPTRAVPRFLKLMQVDG